MPSLNAISPEKLARLVGTPGCPVIVEYKRQKYISVDANYRITIHNRAALAASQCLADRSGAEFIEVVQSDGVTLPVGKTLERVV